MNSKSTWTEEDKKQYAEYKEIVDNFLRPIDNLLVKIDHIEAELEKQNERRRKLLAELRELQNE